MRARHVIFEPKKKVPVISSVDVVVCGGGPSGFIAAIASARNGAKTMLIERYGFLGGMATAGGVGPISKFNLNGRRIVKGIPEEFINRMAGQHGAITDLPSGNVPFNTEMYKLLSINMVREAGVNILLHSLCVGCIYNQEKPGKITHILVENKSGRQAIASKYIIDCTGTGDVISQTKLPWKLRTGKDGELQSMTLEFRLGGVDTESLQVLMAEDKTRYFNQSLRKFLQGEVNKGNLDAFGGPWVIHSTTIREGEVGVNATRFAGNPTNALSLTEAEMHLREDVMKVIDVFKKKAPQFKNCYLIDTATQVGIRESRAIEGLYTMRQEDVVLPKNFSDTIAKGGHPIDIHLSSINSGQYVHFITHPYNIPYRSLVPKGSENVLVGGGTISASREAFATIRVQAQCMALGQAAGTAAALCAKDEIPVENLDGPELRKLLSEQGAIV